MMGSGERGLIVCTPEPPILKRIASAPGSALASRIACLREPGPLSFTFVTLRVLLLSSVTRSVSTRKVPLCWTPKRNWRLMLAPGARGEAEVTDGTDREQLKPPPFGWFGGCSSVVPRTSTEPPPDNETLTSPEVRARKSPTPDGAGKVVRLVMRK